MWPSWVTASLYSAFTLILCSIPPIYFSTRESQQAYIGVAIPLLALSTGLMHFSVVTKPLSDMAEAIKKFIDQQVITEEHQRNVLRNVEKTRAEAAAGPGAGATPRPTRRGGMGANACVSLQFSAQFQQRLVEDLDVRSYHRDIFQVQAQAKDLTQSIVRHQSSTFKFQSDTVEAGVATVQGAQIVVVASSTNAAATAATQSAVDPAGGRAMVLTPSSSVSLAPLPKPSGTDGRGPSSRLPPGQRTEPRRAEGSQRERPTAFKLESAEMNASACSSMLEPASVSAGVASLSTSLSHVAPLEGSAPNGHENRGLDEPQLVRAIPTTTTTTTQAGQGTDAASCEMVVLEPRAHNGTARPATAARSTQRPIPPTAAPASARSPVDTLSSSPVSPLSQTQTIEGNGGPSNFHVVRGERFSGDAPNICFYIERSKNANVVVYEARIEIPADDSQTPSFSSENMLEGYWLDVDPSYVAKNRKKGKMDDREELNFVELRMAYGFSVSPSEEDPEGMDVTMVALPSKKFLLRINRVSYHAANVSSTESRFGWLPLLLGVLNGVRCVVDRAYVKSREPKHFWNLPTVEFVEVTGRSLSTGEVVVERIAG